MADTLDVRCDAKDAPDRESADQGSTLMEQLIAMTIIVGVMLSLLVVLAATTRGVAVGRQRTIAVSLAKQSLESLQGGAYSSVAMDLTSPGLTTDPLVTGSSPNLKFEGEPIVPGATTPYTSTVVSAGTTFTLRAFVTSVSPANGTGYRRVTVIIEWPSSSPATPHSLRFSSLVFPLDYTSYPSSDGAAEATGGLITLQGSLGGDFFEDVRVNLPGVSSDTNASTLRTSIGAAAGSTSRVEVESGPVTAGSCVASGIGLDVGECPRESIDSVADNDAGSTTGEWTSSVGQPFVAGTISTPGGVVVLTPAGTMTSRASTESCGSCGFGDADGVPWAEAHVATSTAVSTSFASDHGAGALTGRLWELAAGWSADVSVDHDTTGGGTVSATAVLTASALSVLQLDGGPTGFEGAVTVSGFTVTASAPVGYTLVAPAVTVGTPTIRLWDGEPGAYRTVVGVSGEALDETATSSVVVGDHVVTFTTHVQTQPSTTSTIGTSPRTDVVAQEPTGLVVTVDVIISSLASSLVTDVFSIVIDFGRVSAHAEWLPSAS